MCTTMSCVVVVKSRGRGIVDGSISEVASHYKSFADFRNYASISGLCVETNETWGLV